jgi:hypothetical protein
MKTIICVYIALIIFEIPMIAQDTINTKDGKRVLLKDDYTWEYVDTTQITEKPKHVNIKYAEEAVTIWDKLLLRRKSEYEQKEVRLYLHYQNNTDKKIIGVVVKVNILNPFGKSVLNNTFNDEIVLEPNERIRNDTYWIFKDNPFIDDEPYDRMWQMAENGTAKINAQVLKVVFDDGTILTAKTVKKKQAKK